MSNNLSVRALRRRWKPHKERLANSPTNIRFHRACSWLQRAEQIIDSDRDLALLTQWIAFNALYGQWDELEHSPVPDRACWRVFLDRILDMDKAGSIAKMLVAQKRLVLSLLEDEYLSRIFWNQPSKEQAKKSRRIKLNAQSWYVERNWTLILDRAVERVYLLRCQLVHGAATYNGALNRTTVRRCSTLMGHLLPAVLSVWIDHGADEDWGIMCFPPLRQGVRA